MITTTLRSQSSRTNWHSEASGTSSSPVTRRLEEPSASPDRAWIRRRRRCTRACVPFPRLLHSHRLLAYPFFVPRTGKFLPTPRSTRGRVSECHKCGNVPPTRQRVRALASLHCRGSWQLCCEGQGSTSSLTGGEVGAVCGSQVSLTSSSSAAAAAAPSTLARQFSHPEKLVL